MGYEALDSEKWARDSPKPPTRYKISERRLSNTKAVSQRARTSVPLPQHVNEGADLDAAAATAVVAG